MRPHRPEYSRRTVLRLAGYGLAAACASALGGCGAASDPARGSKRVGSAPANVTAGTAAFRNTDLGCGWEPTGSLDLVYASQFSVDYYDGGYQLVCVSNGERFLLVPHGAAAPEGLAPDIAPVQLPLGNIYLVSTSMICFVDELDAFDAVAVTSVTAETSPNARLAAAIDEGRVAFGGRYRDPDYELIAQTGCPFALENTKINHVPEAKQKLEDLGVIVMTEQSSAEAQALGRLEWIKLVGTLLDRADEAERRFDEIAARVESVAAQEPTGKTIAFFYINEDGAAATRRSTDYFSQMVSLAGGTYLSFDPDAGNGASSVQLVVDMETFYLEAKDADVIVYNTTVDESVASVDDLVARNALLEDFAAVRAGEVWACDHGMYQQISSMDLIIADIRAALTGAEAANGFLWRLA